MISVAFAAGAGPLRHRLYLLVLDCAARLPLRLAYVVAKWAGRARHRFLLGSLRVNPDMVRALGATPRQVHELARRAAELRAADELEARLYRRLDGPVLGRLIEVEGLANLEQALERGNGAILFSVHVRSAPALFAALAELGHPPSVVGYGPRTDVLPVDRELRLRQMGDLERRFGYRYLRMGEDAFVAARAANILRRNGVVVMLVDLPSQDAAVEVSLLDGRTHLSSGPALLSQTTGASLLDFYLHRRDRWLPLIAEIGAPFGVAGTLEDAVVTCGERMDAHLRRHPAEWTLVSSRDSSNRVDASAPR